MKIDLHIHSIYSDGELKPYEIVEQLKRQGVAKCSITDHDTIIHSLEYQDLFEKSGVEFINGIELNTEQGGMHILGYGIEDVVGLEEYLNTLKTKNEEVCLQLIKKLMGSGYDISLEGVEAERQKSDAKHIDKRTIVKVLIKKGYATTVKGAYDKIIGRKTDLYLPIKKLSAREAIDLITDCGGIPVLAHPASIHLDTEQIMFDKLRELQSYGLQGVEIQNNNSKNYEYTDRVADRLGLLKTIGSDFHARKDVHTLGVESVEDYWYPFANKKAIMKGKVKRYGFK